MNDLDAERTAADRIAQALLDLVVRVPRSTQVPPGSLVTAAHALHERSQALSRKAARQAALAAGSLALPPGPLGWLTLLPELVAVWRVQAQLVADIAALHGQQAKLTREHMIFCLFRHSVAQVARDLAVRSGERWLVQRASIEVIQRVLTVVGVKLSQRTLAKAVSRWVPFVGAAGVAAYAWYDTQQVARTAVALFGRETFTAPDDDPASGGGGAATASAKRDAAATRSERPRVKRAQRA